jgi:tetratricopeptide (TPR) repeat protein
MGLINYFKKIFSGVKKRNLENSILEIEKIMERKDYDTALIKIEEFIAKKLPENKKIKLQILKCKCLNKLEKFEESSKLAVKIFQKPIIGKDSLRNKFDLIEALTQSYFELAKYNEALETIQEAVPILEDNTIDQNNQEWKKKTARYYYWLGGIYRSQGELDLSLSNLEKSLDISRSSNFITGIIDSTNVLGLAYWYKGELDTAKKYFLNTLEYLNANQNKNRKARVLSNLGGIYGMQGELDEALDYFIKALKISQDINNIMNIGVISNNIAGAYYQKGELELAMKYLEIALDNKRKIGNKRYIAGSLELRGRIHSKKGELKQAYQDVKKALDYLKEIENEMDISDTYSLLITILLEQKNFDLANKYLTELKKLNEKNDNKIIDLWYRISLAKVSWNTPNTSRKLSFKSLFGVFNSIIRAKKIFKDIINGEIINYEANVEAIFNLCELLIIEMKTLGNEKLLQEIKKLNKKLFEIANSQNSYSLLVKNYLLEAKLALMESETKKTLEYLKKAKMITEEKGYDRLGIVITQEQKQLEGDLPEWLIEGKTNFLEKLSKIKLDGLIVSLRQNRVENYSVQKKVSTPSISDLTDFANVLQKREVTW